jgi:putative ABC transport system permease protein
VIILSMLSMGVLAVACANVAGLLTSRATARGHEVALRLAVGASRTRIVRQLLVESLGIGLLGGGFGIAVGYAGIQLFQQIRMPSDAFAYPEFRLDERALFFSLIAAIASAFLFGLVPALQTAKVDLISGLKARAANPAKRRPLAGRHLLVAAQVALSLVLLTLAVWAFQMFRHHLGQGPGFRIAKSAKVWISAGQGRTPMEVTRYFEQAADTVRGLPSVTGVTVTSAMPLFGAFQQSAFVPEGYQLPRGEDAVLFLVNHVDEGYFSTMEIPILKGRAFLPTDTADAPRVAIVNEMLAERYWPGRDAVGQRLRLKDAEGPLIQVIGVARTTKYLYFAEPPTEMVYLPFRQHPRPEMVLVAATGGPSASLLAPLGEAVGRIDPDVSLSELQTLEFFFWSRATSFGLVAIRMIGAMGIMGMILTMVGLYALVSYAVSRRTREIGIRMAIGATAARVLGMILHQGMKPAWGGLAVGLALSAAMARLLPELIPLESRYDSRMYLVTVAIIVGVALAAAFLPARRSSRIDPTVALRCE